MRKLVLSLAVTLCMTFLASNAFAAGSLYKTGDKFAGISYYSLTEAATNVTFFGIQGGYFFTDNINLIVNYSFLSSFSTTPPLPAGTSVSGNGLTAMVDYHIPFSSTIGGFAGIGYMTSTMTATLGVTSTTGNGFAYEIGIESKLTNNIIGDIVYRGASLTVTAPAGTTNPTASIFGVDINYLF